MIETLKWLASWCAVLAVLVAAASAGYHAGVTIGRREVHSGRVQCTTLPDGAVACWKVKK